MLAKNISPPPPILINQPFYKKLLNYEFTNSYFTNFGYRFTPIS